MSFFRLFEKTLVVCNILLRLNEINNTTTFHFQPTQLLLLNNVFNHSYTTPSDILCEQSMFGSFKLHLPIYNNKLMLFQDEVPEEVGLFTFYRQQAEREEEIKRQKKLKKKRKEEQAEAMSQSPPKESFTARKIDSKHYLMPKTISNPPPLLPNSKPRSNIPKQRLLESIVDMGKDIDPEPQLTDRGYLVTLKQRQTSHILKSRRYREKAVQLGQVAGEQDGQRQITIQEMRIESLHRRNQSEQLYPQRFKQAIHSVRGSVVQLPQIRKPEDPRMPYRPKKSLKSKLIQDALHSRDRDKIKQIRTYLKAQSPFKQAEEHDDDEVPDQRSFEVFEFRQQKLLGILKRFRKGN